MVESERKRKRRKKPRIDISEKDLKRLFEIHGTASPAVLAKRTGLPYMLVYNILKGRVDTVSNRHYTMLYGSAAPPREALKVDGDTFRVMVELWLFLNDDLTKADLYRDLYGLSPSQKSDHRIFNGKIRNVDARVEHAMRKKFTSMGIDGPLLDQWLDEFEAMSREDWVSYERMRPILDYLEDTLGVHPTSVLKQSVVRYESGELKRVSRNIYEMAVALKQRTQKMIAQQESQSIEKIKEAIVGRKPGYTLYADIEEELTFLRRFAGKSAKAYLGRAAWTYENQRAKRIADWRAQRIIADCERFIRENPTLLISDLPRSSQRRWVRVLTEVLVARTTQLLSDADGIDFEKRILRPVQPRNEYNKHYHGFTPFEMASGVLGMKRKAFDLMVAKNCEIFRSVGKYTRRWYLSDLYLRELSTKAYFDLISAKYELMAKRLSQSQESNACMN